MLQSNRLGNTPPVVLNLIIINALFLLITKVMGNSGTSLVDMLGLHTFFSPEFRVWQLFTNIFLHGDFWHLFFNMFSLWMFGRILEQVWGGKKFLIYYLATGVGASILNSLVNIAEIEMLRRSAEEVLANMSPDAFFSFISQHASAFKAGLNDEFMTQWYKTPDNPMFIREAKNVIYMIIQNRESVVTIGASGSVFGVLLAFGMLFPNMMIMLLIPPIPLKAKYMVMIFAGIELFFGFSGKQPGIAHFAHLGGMLVGFFIIRYWRKHNSLY